MSWTIVASLTEPLLILPAQVAPHLAAARRYILQFTCRGDFEIEVFPLLLLHTLKLHVAWVFNGRKPTSHLRLLAHPLQGQQWVRLEVVGQSFMMHQIRRMVGMALAEFRSAAPPDCLQLALEPDRVMDVRLLRHVPSFV